MTARTTLVGTVGTGGWFCAALHKGGLQGAIGWFIGHALYVVGRTGELGFAGREPKIVEPTRTFVLPISICSQPQTLRRPLVSDRQ